MLRRPPAWSIIALISLGLAAISITSACTKNQRIQTIHATLISVNTTRDEFAAWDLEHQRQIYETVLAAGGSKEDATSKIADYQAKRQRVQAAFELTYKAIALAATQTDQPSLSAALEAVKSLVDSIGKLRGGP